jgi:hypothetical protein
MLEYYAVLERQDKIYRFVPGSFHSILHRTQNVDRLIMLEKSKLLSQ